MKRRKKLRESFREETKRVRAASTVSERTVYLWHVVLSLTHNKSTRIFNTRTPTLKHRYGGLRKEYDYGSFLSNVQVSDQENDGKIRLHFETFMSEVHRT